MRRQILFYYTSATDFLNYNFAGCIFSRYVLLDIEHADFAGSTSLRQPIRPQANCFQEPKACCFNNKNKVQILIDRFIYPDAQRRHVGITEAVRCILRGLRQFTIRVVRTNHRKPGQTRMRCRKNKIKIYWGAKASAI